MTPKVGTPVSPSPLLVSQQLLLPLLLSWPLQICTPAHQHMLPRGQPLWLLQQPDEPARALTPAGQAADAAGADAASLQLGERPPAGGIGGIISFRRHLEPQLHCKMQTSQQHTLLCCTGGSKLSTTCADYVVHHQATTGLLLLPLRQRGDC